MGKKIGYLSIFILLIARCFGQEVMTPSANAIKFDCLGPPAVIFMPSFRVSIEYERKIPKVPKLSFIADAEYRFHYYQFDSLYVLSPNWSWPTETLTVNVDQQNLSIVMGLRYSGSVLKENPEKFKLFAEPRIEIGWIHARIAPGHIAAPITKKEGYALRPRLRAGASYHIGKRVAVEASADGLIYKYLANNRQRLQLIGELNLVYLF